LVDNEDENSNKINNELELEKSVNLNGINCNNLIDNFTLKKLEKYISNKILHS